MGLVTQYSAPDFIDQYLLRPFVAAVLALLGEIFVLGSTPSFRVAFTALLWLLVAHAGGELLAAFISGGSHHTNSRIWLAVAVTAGFSHIALQAQVLRQRLPLVRQYK